MLLNVKQAAWIGALLCIFVSNSSFAIFDDNEARKAILEVRQQVKILEERLIKLETAAQTSHLTLLQFLNEKEKETARLRGELEVANNSIRKLQEDNKTLYTNLDNRIKNLEPKSVQMEDQDINVASEQWAAYQAGLNQFKVSKYKDAVRLFEEFLTKYHSSNLEPHVRYFLGSAQFAQGDYKAALVTQRDLAKDFPDNSRAPDALLSMASSQLELKSVPGAKKTLNELITKYPNSSAATSAKSRLSALN